MHFIIIAYYDKSLCYICIGTGVVVPVARAPQFFNASYLTGMCMIFLHINMHPDNV